MQATFPDLLMKQLVLAIDIQDSNNMKHCILFHFRFTKVDSRLLSKFFFVIDSQRCVTLLCSWTYRGRRPYIAACIESFCFCVFSSFLLQLSRKLTHLKGKNTFSAFWSVIISTYFKSQAVRSYATWASILYTLVRVVYCFDATWACAFLFKVENISCFLSRCLLAALDNAHSLVRRLHTLVSPEALTSSVQNDVLRLLRRKLKIGERGQRAPFSFALITSDSQNRICSALHEFKRESPSALLWIFDIATKFQTSNCVETSSRKLCQIFNRTATHAYFRRRLFDFPKVATAF